jgi:hypothetical protein
MPEQLTADAQLYEQDLYSYRGARKEAAAETGLPLAAFPEAAPFSLPQALDEEFWPEAG